MLVSTHDVLVITTERMSGIAPPAPHRRVGPVDPRWVSQDPEGFVEDGGWDFLNQEAEGSGEEDEEEEGEQPLNPAKLTVCHRQADTLKPPRGSALLPA